MANAKFKAAADIKKLAATFAGVIEFANELEELGSLEKQEDEISSRIARLTLEEAKAKDAANDAKKKLSELQQKSEKEIASLEDRLAYIQRGAIDKAGKIVSDAEVQAEKTIYDAKQELDAFSAKKKDLEKYSAALDDQIKEKSEVLKKLDSRLEEFKKALGGV